jgi:carbamoyl-phosphate synthase large subunit
VPALYSLESISYPVFVKPYDGSRSVDSFLVTSPDKLTEYHRKNEKFMFMEAVDTSRCFEVTIDMYFGRSGTLRSVVPRRRLEVRDGEVNKGITMDGGLVAYVSERLGSLPGVRGCINLQVFVDQETSVVYGIEINPRFGGGYPLSYGAGANFPQMMIREYLLGEAVTGFDDTWQRGMTMLRFDEEVFVQCDSPIK